MMAENFIEKTPVTLTFIVTCKGRLHHLQQSLPLLAQQENTQCIVVDYNCPQGTGDWVATHFPKVQVVRVSDKPHFHVSHARNLGANAANSTWICFLDADTLLHVGFLQEIMPLLTAKKYLQPAPFIPELCGLLICRLEDFQLAGGYDEVFQGWGCEDNDLVLRLRFLNCQYTSFANRFVDFIPHDSDERVRFYKVNDHWLSLRINGMYFQIKTDIAKQLGGNQLSLQQRQELYDKVSKAILSDPTQTAQIEISFTPELDFILPPDWQLNRTWVYQFKPIESPQQEHSVISTIGL